jgi:hypothetical protein
MIILKCIQKNMLGRRGLASSGLGYGEIAGCEYGNESKSFIYQQMHFISVLENINIYIKTYITIAATCFGLRPSSGSSHTSLAKVTFIKSVKLRRCGLCGFVAACYIKSMVVCLLCAVKLCTCFAAHAMKV